jgi:dolichol-phosphate mannosyltransferase
MKVALLDDPRIELQQRWLDGYQLEVYLLIKLLKLGYRHTEVPVGEVYPSRSVGNAKRLRHLPISGTSLA